MTYGEACRQGQRELAESGIPSAFLDTTIILASLLGISREILLAYPEHELGTCERPFRAAITRRKTGLPVAYITGIKEFWGLNFHVSPDVLIPKPDTELLVEKSLEILRHMGKNRIDEHPLNIADICTGSGCAAVSLLHSLAERDFSLPYRVLASDISDKALDVARRNADNLLSPPARKALVFYQGDLLDAISEVEPFDLIISNPPYVPSRITRELLADGRSEPALALDGGEDGLDIIRRLIPQAMARLKKGGLLLIETGEYNAGETRLLFGKAGFTGIVTYDDIEGAPRVTGGVKP
ncbi:MAG: peptide chain release factor N(5)-glutamine methyltransferase [Spirochaetaceae bacterium]|jgi:release factor glutamine methyltransferase|nr:peptide chain release factor N(5)-glutamine methyltransferase [Spirochaetaceae bacterium]